jgi:DNA polymerase-3 subunit epsilon
MAVVGGLWKHPVMGIFDKAKKAVASAYNSTEDKSETNYGKFVVLDVETTGLDPVKNRILEIALATVENGIIVESWTTRFNPEGPVGKTEIHGITEGDVKDAPLFKEKSIEILDRIQNVAVVAHNSRFDLAFLHAEFDRMGLKMPWVAGICTLTISNYYQPHLSRRRLADCCEDIGISIENAHSAMGDAHATAKLFHYYLMPNKRPAPRKEDLEVVKNPVANSIEVVMSGRRNPVVSQRIEERKNSQEIQINTNLYKELVKILAACSFQEVLEKENFSGEFAYLEKVIEFLEDGQLNDSEREELISLACIYDLSESQIEIAHESLIKALAIQALKDESISVGEREELNLIASALGLSQSSLTSIVKDAKKIRLDSLSRVAQQLPENWKLGEPLRVGQKVVFTGCDPVQRTQLENDSKKAGVAISGKVSSKTALLITDGSYDGNKARDAREIGVRVVTPDEYELMLKYIQPAEVDPSNGETTTKSSQSGAEGLDPSVVRAWALKNGIKVSPKGRIHTEVYEAYKKRESD